MSSLRAMKPRLEDIKRKLSVADTLLNQGLTAINHGRRLEAMEDVYTASCLIQEIETALDSAPASVETRTLC